MAADEDALLDSLIEKEIPHGMQELVESHTNLANLAAYCKENYRQNSDKNAVLKETKRYASQSLASVAYQVHSLAVNMLQMIDQQVIQLKKMEASVAEISLTVDIHKEKVARREIGALTASKNVTKGLKIIVPATQEKQQRYKREEIDYSILDDIGHGVRTETKKVVRRPSQTSTGSGVTKIPLSGGESFRSSSSSINDKGGNRSTPLPPPVPPPLPPSVPPSAQQFSIPTPPSSYSSSSSMPPPPPPNVGGSNAFPPPPPPNVGGTNAPPPPPPPDVGRSNAPPPPPPPPPPPLMPSSSSSTGPPKAPPPPAIGGPMPPPPPSLVGLPHPPAPLAANPSGPSGPMAAPPPPPPPQLPAPISNMPPPPAPIFDSGLPAPPSPLDDASCFPPPMDSMLEELDESYDAPSSQYADQTYDIPPNNYSQEEPGYQAGFLTAQVLYKVRALFGYTRDKDDELEFNEGDIISVIREHDDGWLDGITEDGQTGLLPCNYVVRLETD